jgi:5-methylcytosine-specific restriction endonuclease McrA
MRWARYPLHAALRAFVHVRDEFTCQDCGTRVINSPDLEKLVRGRAGTLVVERKTKGGEWTFLVVDHIISRRNGGSNHPQNLQSLCYPCNSAKSGLVDAKVKSNGAH